MIPRSPERGVRLESERKAAAVTDAALAWVDRSSLRQAAPPGGAGLGRPAPQGRLAPQGPVLPVGALLRPARAVRAAARSSRRPLQRRRRAGRRADTTGQRYDGEVAYVDAELRRLLDALSSRGLLSNTVDRRRGGSRGEPGRARRAHARHAALRSGRARAVDRQGARHQAGRAHGPRQPGRHRADDPRLGATGVRPDPAACVRRDACPASAMDGVDLLRGPQPPTANSTPRPTTRASPAGRRSGRSSRARGNCSARLRWSCTTSSAIPAKRRTSPASERRSHRAMAIRIGDLDAAGQSAASTPSPEVQERLRALGYVAASPSASIPADAPNAAREIAAWGEFEDALADVSSGRRDRALPRLAALAARYPDAQVFRTRTRAGAPRFGACARGAEGVSQRWPRRGPPTRRSCTTSQWRARPPGASGEALRAEQAALALDPKYPPAHNGLGLLHADAGRRCRRRGRVPTRRRTRAEQPFVLDESRQRRA